MEIQIGQTWLTELPAVSYAQEGGNRDLLGHGTPFAILSPREGGFRAFRGSNPTVERPGSDSDARFGEAVKFRGMTEGEYHEHSTDTDHLQDMR